MFRAALRIAGPRVQLKVQARDYSRFHKLNMLFYEKCGVSAKHWLLEQHLGKVRELLLATSMKITDVAQECGFNGHAHSCESFKRRYKDCMRSLRQKNNLTLDAMEDSK
ncbi:transcriptional regulator GlxA family with amidase domain [Paraburkholderia sp. Clong3]|uniref:helix-turn-helix domain-containing protein n=1 Tax=Paraburkholderia sp. Clong3 TaxID=2991061 RepID=UPI00105257D2|nr:helix-turn-helix domain-containing protein [Paraburkholderia sp. BL8N3]